MKKSFMGYRRDNGRVGIRNHVIILPLDDLSNAACEAVANNVKGTLALPHAYGRLQFGEDLDLHFRTLIGVGCNPNVAAVVVIGIEPLWTQRIVDGIAKTGKPVAGFGIEKHGDLETIRMASLKAKEFMHYATELQRTECAVNELWVSCKCGESDTTSGIAANPTVGNAFDKLWEAGATTLFGETTEITGGEHLVMERCANEKVRAQFKAFFDRYAKVVDDHKTNDLCDSQPTKGNIEGGLTTIEEKALGNIQKIGRKAPIIGCLDKAESPRPRSVVHGLLLRRCGNGDAVRRLRFRGALFPHRAGQHHRQPDTAGHQTFGQPAHCPHDERTHRRGRLRHPAPRNESGPGRRQAAGNALPHLQRAQYFR